MLANQWVHQKDTCMYKENYTKWRENDIFKENMTYMYQGWGAVGELQPWLGSLQAPLPK